MISIKNFNPVTGTSSWKRPDTVKVIILVEAVFPPTEQHAKYVGNCASYVNFSKQDSLSARGIAITVHSPCLEERSSGSWSRG